MRAARLRRSAARVAVRRRCSSPRPSLKERGPTLRPCLPLSGILGFGQHYQRACQFVGAEGVGSGRDNQLTRCSTGGRSVRSASARIAELNRRAAESETRLKRLYDAIEAGVADLDDPALKDRIDGLTAIRDQAKPIPSALRPCF